MIQIQVERVTTKPKVLPSGDEAWSVFFNNEWYDIFGLDHKPERGEVLEVDKVNAVVKNGRTFRNARVKPSPKQVEKAKEVLKPSMAQVVEKSSAIAYENANRTPIMHGESSKSNETEASYHDGYKMGQRNPDPRDRTRTTPYTQPIEAWEKVINRAMDLAGTYGITDDAARVSFVAIFIIPFGEGKLSIDDLGKQEWPTPERQKELDGWGDRDWTDGPQKEDSNPMEKAEREKYEAEMEAAKARTQKLLDEQRISGLTPGGSCVDRDYKTQLGAAIKSYCFQNKLDFNANKFEVLWRCAGTRKLESLDQGQAQHAIEQLGRLP